MWAVIIRDMSAILVRWLRDYLFTHWTKAPDFFCSLVIPFCIRNGLAAKFLANRIEFTAFKSLKRKKIREKYAKIWKTTILRLPSLSMLCFMLKFQYN